MNLEMPFFCLAICQEFGLIVDMGHERDGGSKGGGDSIFDDVKPLAERDMIWHRRQADELDLPGLDAELRNRSAKQDWRGAVVYLEALHARAPASETALKLAQMLRRCRAEDEAQLHLQGALLHWPQDPALHQCLAESAMATGDFSLGFRAWERVIAAQPSPGRYPILRALACLRLSGQGEAATQFITQHAAALGRHMPRIGTRMLHEGRGGLSAVPPGLYLVSGNNGVGKTTLGHFLQALGHQIIDADRVIASFCAMGQFSDLRYDLVRRFPDAQISWVWPAMRADQYFDAVDTERDVVFVIGGFGATVAPYVNRFRHILHLTVPDHVIAARLKQRNSPSHAPGSKGFAAALRRNAREATPDYPAQIIPANRPVAMVCAASLAAIGAPINGHAAQKSN